MKEICKKLYKWVVLLLQSIVTMLSVLLFSSYQVARKNKKMSKMPKSRDCLILGNGPSLKKCLETSINKIREFDTVAVNLFCESKEFNIVKPVYYVVTDPGFFDPNPKNDRIASVQQRFIKGMMDIDWEITLFVPSVNRKSAQVKTINNTNIHVVFYNYTPVEGFLCLQHWLYRRNLGMPFAMNVVCASIFLMINIGYKNIYMIGIDHNMLKNLYVNDNNELMLTDDHFYGKTDIKISYGIREYVNGYAVCMATHERLSEYARTVGVNLWNATKGSYVDAYKRDYIFN